VRINPIALMSLIVLVIITGLFTLLVVVKTNNMKRFIEKGYEPGFRTNQELESEIKELLNRTEAAKRDLAARQRELDRQDLLLAPHRHYISGDRGLLGGIATPDKAEDTILGKPTRLKDSQARLVSLRIENAAKRLEIGKADAESGERQKSPSLDDSIRKRQDELNAVLRRISDQESLFNKDRDELTKRLDELTKAKEDAEKAQRQEYSRRATKVAQLEDDIRQLLELQLKWVSEIDADGKILQASPDQVIVDIGARERVTPGMRFSVFNFSQGKQVMKGMVEVVQAAEGISRCRVLDVVDARKLPIGPGDHIGNPVFDPVQKRIFYLAGEFKHYNRDDLASFVRAAGGVVADRLGPHCDFLVAGDRSDREQATARQFQVQAMNEDFLLRYLQPTFGPKPAARKP
jgi:hypothetical protein